MIRCSVFKYQLTPRVPLGAAAGLAKRSGALLRVEWPNSVVGYSDLFPWPEFGDSSLAEQIAGLAQGRISPLVEQSMWLAKKDAQLRRNSKNAFVGVPRVKNHYLINDFTKFSDADMNQARNSGFSTFKIKIGKSVTEEAKFITRLVRQHPVLVRLDANAKLDFSEFEGLVSHLSPADKSKVEFVEDPIPWDLEAWKEAAKILPLALDFESSKVDWSQISGKPPFSVMVIKPARQDMDKALACVNKHSLKMVVTSSMDHPVGIAHALAQASELKKTYPNILLDCGCLTLRSYEPNDFYSHMETSGPFLKQIKGFGIGFDDLLKALPWESVR